MGDRRVWWRVPTRSIDGLRTDSRGLVAGRISSWAARRCPLLCGFCGSLRAFGACLLLSLWQILRFFSGLYRSVDRFENGRMYQGLASKHGRVMRDEKVLAAKKDRNLIPAEPAHCSSNFRKSMILYYNLVMLIKTRSYKVLSRFFKEYL